MTGIEQSYTPSLDDVRNDYLRHESREAAEFDRMIAAHDEAVRQEEREKAAQIAESHGPEREPGDDEWAEGFEAAQEVIARSIREQS